MNTKLLKNWVVSPPIYSVGFIYKNEKIWGILRNPRKLFMQNKPNFKRIHITASDCITGSYNDLGMNMTKKANPIKPNFQAIWKDLFRGEYFYKNSQLPTRTESVHWTPLYFLPFYCLGPTARRPNEPNFDTFSWGL